MKQLYFLLIAVFLILLNVNAQIPNSGFENWISYGNGMKPAEWWNPNDSLSPSAIYFPVSRSTDHYPEGIGSYSIRLENNPSVSPEWAKAGIIWTGDWSGNDNPVFPVTGHPTSLRGYYKFLPQNHDTMDIHFVLYKNGIQVTGGGYKSAATAAVWTPFIATVTNATYPSADSARIMISAFNSDNGPTGIQGNSVLYVDNLNFDKLLGIEPEIKTRKAEFQVFPNPAVNFVTLNIYRNGSSEITLKIYNVIGKIVKEEKILIDKQLLDLTALTSGMYCIEVISPGWSEKQKLIIRK